MKTKKNKKLNLKETIENIKIPLLPEEYDEPHEIKSKLREEIEEFQQTFFNELTKLITSSFGLMAALSWRDVVREFIDSYVRRFFGNASGLISEFIFALIITTLAVVITWRMAKLKDRLLRKKEKSSTE